MNNLCNTCIFLGSPFLSSADEHIRETEEKPATEVKWCMKLNCSKDGTFVRQCQFWRLNNRHNSEIAKQAAI
jgi:hypothetical protein